MKPGSINAGRVVLALLIIGTTLALVSWNRKPTHHQFRQSHFYNDTVPKVKKTDREKKVRDLDDVLDELNTVDMNVEMEKAQKEIQEAMKGFDAQKLKIDMEKAMKDVDFQKIQKEVTESMGKMNLDLAKMQKELRNP